MATDKVAGRLAFSWEGWMNIGSDEWDFTVLKGNRIPFYTLSPLTSEPLGSWTSPGSEKARLWIWRSNY